MQQGISILSGLLILVAACTRIFKFSAPTNGSSFLLKPFHKLFGYALKHKANHLIIGMINGLLPCGFVYLALAGAVFGLILARWADDLLVRLVSTASSPVFLDLHPDTRVLAFTLGISVLTGPMIGGAMIRVINPTLCLKTSPLLMRLPRLLSVRVFQTLRSP